MNDDVLTALAEIQKTSRDFMSLISKNMLFLVTHPLNAFPELISIYDGTGTEIVKRARLRRLNAWQISKLDEIRETAASERRLILAEFKEITHTYELILNSASQGAPEAELDLEKKDSFHSIIKKTTERIKFVSEKAGLRGLTISPELVKEVCDERQPLLAAFGDRYNSRIMARWEEFKFTTQTLQKELEGKLQDVAIESNEIQQALKKWQLRQQALFKNVERLVC